MAPSKKRRGFRIFAGIFIIAGILFFGSLIASYFFKDDIVAVVLQEINKNLAVPIAVNDVNFSSLQDFPQMGISLHDVKVPSAIPNAEEPFVTAGKITVLFDVWDLIRGDYTLRSIDISRGQCNIRTLADGSVNYEVWQSQPKTEKDTATGHLKFDLQSIQLQQFLFRFADDPNNTEVLLYAENTKAHLAVDNDQYTIDLNGTMQSRGIHLGNEEYLHEKPLRINTSVTYDMSEKELTILPSDLEIRGSAFQVGGRYSGKGKPSVDIAISADEVNLRTLLSLLPESLASKLSPYRSEGRMYFSGNIKGQVGGRSTPGISFDFGGQDVSFNHPDLSQAFDHVFFEGNFNNGRRHTLATSSLSLRNIKAQIDGKPLSGIFTLSNFDDYFVDCGLQGKIDLPSLLELAKVESLEEANGFLDAEVTFKGKLSDLEKRETLSRISTSGTIAVRDLGVTLEEWPIPIDNVSGTFRFNSTDVALQNVQGYVGNSHLRLNGLLNNVLGFLLLEDQDFVVQAGLASDNLDLDELLSGNRVEDQKEIQDQQAYAFTLPHRVVLDLDADIKQLKFQRLHGRNLQGNISLENRVATLSGGSLYAMGGRIQLTGNLDGRDSLRNPVDLQMRLERLDLDSIFYVLRDFDQGYLTHRNLKGQIFADIDALLPFDNQLFIKLDSMIADISMSVRNGELNNFAPMQELSRFMEEGELANLRFSELNNNLRVEEGKIYIPQMEITTNIAQLSIRGIQGFNNDIDYRFRVGLEEFRRPDADARFGVVEEDDSGLKNVFIRIHGNLEDYDIEYDGQSAREYRRTQRRQNPFRLRDLFQTRDRNPKQIELNEEEFFEWEEGG